MKKGRRRLKPLSASRRNPPRRRGVAAKRWTAERKRQLRDSRILSAQNLRAGLEKSKIDLKVFISASGVGFYGDRGDAKLPEQEPAGQDFLAQLCVEWETAADRMPAKRIVKCRFGIVLASEGGFLSEVIPLFKKVGASRLGSGEQWMTWIHLDDLVDVLTFALTDERVEGAINCVSPRP